MKCIHRLHWSSGPVVEDLDHGLKELGRRGAINHSMVKRQTEPKHRALCDRSVEDGGLFDDSADAEDSGLSGIQNRCERVDAEHAEVGDRKRSAGHVFELEVTGARLFTECAALDRDFPKRLAFGATARPERSDPHRVQLRFRRSRLH